MPESAGFQLLVLVHGPSLGRPMAPALDLELELEKQLRKALPDAFSGSFAGAVL